jgi:prevent-host-death family protein
MTITREIAAAQETWFDLIEQVEHGETVVLTQSGVPVARLVTWDGPAESAQAQGREDS